MNHTEPGMIEGEPAEIGRDPRRMTGPELEALGHVQRPLLDVIPANCIECCGGMQAEVRRCRIVTCNMWPYRLSSNPFRKREMTDEQRAEVAARFAAAREARNSGGFCQEWGCWGGGGGTRLAGIEYAVRRMPGYTLGRNGPHR